MSVLYLTFIPLPVPDSPSRASSKRRRERSGDSSSISNDGLPLAKEESQTSPSKTTHRFDVADRQAEELQDGSEQQNYREKGWTCLRQCAEVVSLCRVRDAMGHTMDPMMGLLKCVCG